MTLQRPTAVIFDLDGTLVDVSPFIHLVQGPHKDFDAFHSRTNAEGRPVAWVQNLARSAAAHGHQVIVVTGRPARHRVASQEWLARHLGQVPHLGPITRERGDGRTDVEVKREIHAHLQSWYEIVGAVDDRPGVLNLWRELGLDPTVVLRPDWADAGEHYADADLTAWSDQEALRRAHGWTP